MSRNLDLRCVLLWQFHLRPLEILLRPVLHDGVCPWVSRYYQFQFPQVYISHQKFTGRISFQCGRFFYRPSGPWMDSLTIWRNKLAKPKPQDWVVQPLYFLFNTEILTSCLTGKKTSKQHYNESARDTLRMAGKETSWVGPASRTTQSSWHKHQLLGQRWGQGSRQLPAAAGRRQGKGYLWNYLKAVLLNLWSLQISPSKFN